MTQPWLELDDSHLSSAQLMAEIEERVARREAAYGRFQPHYPTFGHVSPMPAPPNAQFAPNLYHHLHALNHLDAPPTLPELAASPATRVPILGRLWGLLRRHGHNLVLFYVNRNAAYNSQVNAHLVNTLNELTRLTQEQQQEMDRLRAEITTLRGQDAR